MQTIIKKNKHTAFIVAWRSCLDIDIAFEDGVLLSGITWNQFIKKQFIYPTEENIKKQAEKYIYKNYKYSAKHRGIEFKLTKQELLQYIHEPCYLCGRTDFNELKIANSTYKYNGLDRIDNSIGYQIGNIAPCCAICNKAKSTLSLTEFVSWINLVKQHIDSTN